MGYMFSMNIYIYLQTQSQTTKTDKRKTLFRLVWPALVYFLAGCSRKATSQPPFPQLAAIMETLAWVQPNSDSHTQVEKNIWKQPFKKKTKENWVFILRNYKIWLPKKEYYMRSLGSHHGPCPALILSLWQIWKQGSFWGSWQTGRRIQRWC